MNPYLERFLFAMVAGIVTAFVIEVGIKNFWRKVVRPWYEDIVYKDTKIEGKWAAETTIDGKKVERLWEIKRLGHQVWADVTSTHGDDWGQTFRMTGNFKNNILTGSYTPNDPSRKDRGTYTLLLIDDGQRFKGVIAHYSAKTERMSSSTYNLWRLDSKAYADKALPARVDNHPAARKDQQQPATVDADRPSQPAPR